MITIPICLSLLTMIAAVHLIAKVKKENFSSMYKWLSYFILAAATTVLVCQSVCAVRMCCSKRCGTGMEHCMMAPHHGMNCGNDKGSCGHSNMKCDDKKMCGHDMYKAGKDSSACCADEKKDSSEVK